MSDDLTEEAAGTYAGLVGERLRRVRRQQRLSLHGVEAASGQEFRASVLGAYERGERAISVPRLQRLAKFYNVPVDQLLPRDTSAEPGWTAGQEDARGDESAEQAKLSIDLVALEEADFPEKELFGRYVAGLQLQRQDFNGRILTIRHDDVRLIASMFGVNVSQLRHRFEELGIIH